MGCPCQKKSETFQQQVAQKIAETASNTVTVSTPIPPIPPTPVIQSEQQPAIIPSKTLSPQELKEKAIAERAAQRERRIRLRELRRIKAERASLRQKR